MANFLPFDIICDILVRLPVKSLVLFKCVCKSWHSLIESSNFIKSHHKYSLETNSNLSLIFALKDPKHSDEIELSQLHGIFRSPGLHESSQTSLGSILYLPLPVAIYDYCGVIYDHCRVRFVGSSNGLICIRSWFCLALTNPSTRMLKVVPYYDYNSPDRERMVCYGFGYDSRGDDYKIVGMLAFFVVLYSLRTQSWRELRYRGQCPSRDGANAVLVNGRLHWTLPHWGSVLSFDLHDEEWHEVPLPEYHHVDNFECVQLSVLDGCLCVTYSIRSSSSCNEIVSHVWVMKEYGVKESWTKLFTFPFLKVIPLGSTKGHEVLFSKGLNLGLFLWNTEDKTMRDVEGPLEHYSQVTVCVDTLAPLAHGSVMLQGEVQTKQEERRVDHEDGENLKEPDSEEKETDYCS